MDDIQRDFAKLNERLDTLRARSDERTEKIIDDLHALHTKLDRLHELVEHQVKIGAFDQESSPQAVPWREAAPNTWIYFSEGREFMKVLRWRGREIEVMRERSGKRQIITADREINWE